MLVYQDQLKPAKKSKTVFFFFAINCPTQTKVKLWIFPTTTKGRAKKHTAQSHCQPTNLSRNKKMGSVIDGCIMHDGQKQRPVQAISLAAPEFSP